MRKNRRLSEASLSESAGISRFTLRSVEAGNSSATLHSYLQVGDSLDRETLLLSVNPNPFFSEYSTLGVCMKVQMGNTESWKQHFFDLVDEFRRTLDPRLLLLPPPSDFEQKPKALLSSIVFELCVEASMDVPKWAEHPTFLEKPWFLSDMENLMAMALLESPLAFRRNNIFVLDNFMRRA